MLRFPLRVALALAAAAVLVTASGCGEETVEEKLEAANAAVARAEEELAVSRATLEEREEALDVARQARDEAVQTVSELESELADARASVGLQATDEVLFRAVQKVLLEERDLEDVAISAAVGDGVVTLRGQVPDAELRDRAVEVSEQVPGVRRVVSQIEVPGPEPEPAP